MSAVLLALAAVTALAAAARSTWSPCGLSMLSSITPLSERARGHRYGVTAGWFVVGSTLGGATLGALASLGAWSVMRAAPSAEVLGVLAAAAALGSVALDIGSTPWRLPLLRRQVNERWLDQFRGWFYGAAFGWQIGVGFATYLMTAAVPLLLVLAVLTGNPLGAFAVATLFGAARGLVVLGSRRSADPLALRSLHRRLDALEAPVRTACLVVEALAAVVSAVLVGPAGALVIGVALGALVVTARLRPTTS